jgi:photosystem II stability/assembly factor-like uncharacterized protein
MRVLSALASLAVLVLAGCVQPPSATLQPSSAMPSVVSRASTFVTKMIDTVRAGGEPVIQVTQKGTILVAAHPGWTHTRYPPSPDLVLPASGQSYMWRSTDNGSTWAPLGLPMTPGVGPRGLGQGVSDPDFAMDSKGTIYFTDLEALAAASVSWSTDDGQTWLLGNDLASAAGGGTIDRNFLAAHGTDVYFEGNFAPGGETILKSSDGGMTWSKVGNPPCTDQQFVSDAKGDLLVGCPTGLAISTDSGAHWDKRLVPDAKTSIRSMAEPVLDGAGNVYVTWSNESGVFLAGSPDLGKSWWTPINVALPLFPNASGGSGASGTHVWPWVVAGDAGRVAVAWYATKADGGPRAAKGDWFVYETTVLGADSSSPRLYPAQVTPSPIFQGAICQGGTGCQLDPSPAGDRRLGDFFEATADQQGRLLVVYAVALQDSISHPGFARETAGPLLVANATST